MKHFALVVGFASGKKCSYLTDCGDLEEAVREYRVSQMKGYHAIIEDKGCDYPIIVSAELIRIYDYGN